MQGLEGPEAPARHSTTANKPSVCLNLRRHLGETPIQDRQTFSKTRASGKVILRLIFNLLVFAASIWFLWDVLKGIGFEAVARRIARADVLLVGGVLVANVARFMLLGLRWEFLVRSEAPIGYRKILSVLMAGNFLNLVAPALRVAGPVLRAFYLSKETGKPRARFYGTIIADQTANFSIFIIGMVVSGVITARQGHPGISIVAGLAVLAAVAGGQFIGWRHLQRLKNGTPTMVWVFVHKFLKPDEKGKGEESKTMRFLAWWEHLLEALSDAVIGKKSWWPAMGSSALLFLTLAGAQTLALAAVGHPITLAQGAFAISAAAFVQMLAASPGGPGITEASLVLIFLGLGVDVESAAAGTFVARMMNYLVLLPWGGFEFFKLQRRYGAASEGSSAPAEA
jgi:uncharacterized protein (TIRG00374 family)